MTLSDKIMAAQLEMREIVRRRGYKSDKLMESRLYLLEDELVIIANAILVLLEAKEKHLWPV